MIDGHQSTGSARPPSAPGQLLTVDPGEMASHDDRRLVVTTIAGLAVVCLCGAIITALVDAVSESDHVTVFDHRTLDWVLEHRSNIWTTAARTITHLGDPWLITLVVIGVAIVLYTRSYVRLACFVILSSSGAAIASSVAKQVIDRQRPPSDVWLGRAWGPSFPSGHATQSIACWGAVAVVAFVLVGSRRWRVVIVAVAVSIALAVGTSRIYLGVHWFSDVVCGWALATLWLVTLVLAGWATPRLRTVWIRRRGSAVEGSDPTPDGAQRPGV